MANNLTTAALNGNCVGAFTATAIISNNGVNCRASVEQMKNSNFYYFYYSYLKALHEGNTRSAAFFAAQQAYSAALLLDSKKPLRAGSNYQFNLYNLLVYHNFGVIEPNAAAMALSTSEGYIAQAGQSVPKQTVPNFTQTSSGMNANRELLSDGKSVGTVKTIKWTEMNELQTGTYSIHAYTSQKLDNGDVRLTLDYTAPAGMMILAFSPPNGEFFKLSLVPSKGGREQQSFDITSDELKALRKVQVLTINFFFNDNDRFFVLVRVEDL